MLSFFFITGQIKPDVDTSGSSHWLTAALAYSEAAMSHSCRDGLSEPPPAPKKRNTVAEKSNPKPMISEKSPSPFFSHATQPSHTIRPKAKTKTPGQTSDMMQQLESLHESAKDQKSIRFPEGQRLKLDNPSVSATGPSKRRPKPPPPNFELKFADLNDSPPASQYHIPVNDDDDEDLPDIHDLLNAYQPSDAMAGQKKSSSASDYSNSEIDALIRDIPLDEYEAELADDSCIHGDLDSWRHFSRPVTPLPSRKRPREPENEPPKKRFDTRIDTPSERFTSSSPISQPRKRKRSKAPLFFADLSDKDTKEQPTNRKSHSSTFMTDSNNQKPENQKEECFTLDYSLFDIIPAPPDSSMDTTSPGHGSKPPTSSPSIPDKSPLNHSAYASQDHQSSRQAFGRNFILHSGATSSFTTIPPSTTATFSSSNDTLRVSTSPAAYQAESTNTPVDETGVPDNDLAELEAWLLSDAVIITD
ncbi:hypothetical protein PILCRDRAFT_4735 [Piloderma croceum F 1598]|uniref:Uncharacterized protein n=1 Tax=Piloderma croceum (strain F 1598) TaxID=765440 RepID=A0A0C3C936_PILCF|nr:hypothetical protein PILCRDRAFT_4735 [Piloderma croceum F 1598]